MDKNSFLKFSSLSFQICILIVLASFFGHKIDTYFSISKPYFSGLFIMMALAGIIYSIIQKSKK